MKKLKTMLFVLLASLATTPLWADAESFSGPYVGINLTAAGIELDGQHTDNTGDKQGDVTKGTGGKVSEIGGFELGFSKAMGSNFTLGLGATYIPGEASISKGDDAADAADVELRAENFITGYVMAQYAVSDTSALYAKLGQASSGIKVIGDATGKPNDLQGSLIAVGSKSKIGERLFIATEAGMIEYDTITLTGIGGEAADTLKGDPKLAYGTVTIGLQF